MKPKYSLFQQEFLARTIDSLKPHPAVHVGLVCKISEVLEIFTKQKIGSVLVINATGELKGICTERDLISKYALEKGVSPETSVSKIMTDKVQTIPKNASIARALYFMSVGHYRHIPVIYPGSKEYKVISAKDFVDRAYERLAKRVLEEDQSLIFDSNAVDLFFASDVSVLSPQAPILVPEDVTVERALIKLKSGKQGCVIIHDRFGEVRGIFSERDYITKVAFPALDPASTPIASVMTNSPKTLMAGATVALAFSLLSQGGFRHLPIVDMKENATGVISVRTIIDYLSQSIISELGS